MNMQQRPLPYFILLLKAIALCTLAIMIRGTLPRYRFDHLIQLTWKHFIFLWLAFLVINVMWLVVFYNF